MEKIQIRVHLTPKVFYVKTVNSGEVKPKLGKLIPMGKKYCSKQK